MDIIHNKNDRDEKTKAVIGALAANDPSLVVSALLDYGLSFLRINPKVIKVLKTTICLVFSYGLLKQVF